MMYRYSLCPIKETNEYTHFMRWEKVWVWKGEGENKRKMKIGIEHAGNEIFLHVLPRNVDVYMISIRLFRIDCV